MKLSVITVAFNSAATIADTLRSVDAQDWPEREHVIVDGVSTDSTLREVDRFQQPWRRVVCEPDIGIYDAMNKGIRLTTGDVVGFINSDDIYASPDVLSQVAAVFSDDDVDACYGDLCYVEQKNVTKIVRYWRSSPFEPGLFARGWCPPHPTFFARRKVFDRLGGFDLGYRMANDVELMARFLEVHRIRSRYLPELMVKMRMGGASNRSLSAVLLQNREIWRSLNAHEMHPSLLPFVLGKLVSRGRQFLSRP